MYWDETYWSGAQSAASRFIVDAWQGAGERSSVMSLDVKATCDDPNGDGEDVGAVFLGGNVTFINDPSPL